MLPLALSSLTDPNLDPATLDTKALGLVEPGHWQTVNASTFIENQKFY